MASAHDLPPVPGRSGVRRIGYDEAAVAEVAATLGVDVAPAPFRAPAGAVSVLTVPAATDGWAPVRLTLWPGLGRVDAGTGQAVIVMDGIVAVDLVRGVEVQFRRHGGYLVVARGGKVVVRT